MRMIASDIFDVFGEPPAEEVASIESLMKIYFLYRRSGGGSEIEILRTQRRCPDTLTLRGIVSNSNPAS